MTADLVAFLNARLDEAWGDAGGIHAYYCANTVDDTLCNCGVPARVLADVQAKRAILAAYATQYEAARQDVPNPPEFSPYKAGRLVGLQMAIQAWASVYADHPDFDPAWQVSTTTGGGHPG